MADDANLPSSEPNVLSVSQLIAGLKGLLDERIGRRWVVGEISNLRCAASGHYYFTLKDEDAQIRSVLFRGFASQIPFEPQEGQEVLVYGEVTLYEARGDLQILVRRLEPRGRGALQLAIEQLRARLANEGLFDESRKRPLPAIPRRIGVVTSATGAALRDVIEVSGRRFPAAKLLLSPTRVQGVGAEDEIAAALRALYEIPDLDLILLVRGGGSLEDLYPFSTEVVARTLIEAPVPVISGVGHEIDVSIADLVADLRAPTPSAAAELALPDREELYARLSQDWDRLLWAMESRLERARGRLERRCDALRTLSPAARLQAQWLQLRSVVRALRREMDAQLGRRKQRVECSEAALRALLPTARLVSERRRLQSASRELLQAIRGKQQQSRARFGEIVGKLDSLSPLAVLSRGYSIVRRVSDGKVLHDAEGVLRGESLSIRLSRGELDVSVTGLRKTSDDAGTR